MIEIKVLNEPVIMIDEATANLSHDPENPTVINPISGAKAGIGVFVLGGHPIVAGLGSLNGAGSWSNNPYTIIEYVKYNNEYVFEPFDKIKHATFISTTMNDSDKGWILRGGDWWPMNMNKSLQIPDLSNKIHDIISSIGAFIDVNYLISSPKLMSLVRLHGDRLSPKTAMGADRDAGWLQRYWDYRSGEPKLTGYQTFFQRGTEGMHNMHYDTLLWNAFAFLLDQTQTNWDFGYHNALVHACLGRVHIKNSQWNGRSRYEKGFTTPGDWNLPDWAKQWSLGLSMWAFLTDDPILVYVLNQSLDRLKLTTPQQAWDGAWGERIGANWLHEVVTASILRPNEQIYKTHMSNAVDYFLSLRNTAGWWTNIGNGGTAPASPWMASKLIHAMWRALNELNEPWDSHRRQEVVAAAEAIYRDGFYEWNGVIRCRYRFPPQSSPLEETPAQLAISIPMFRIMAIYYPEKWLALYERVSTWSANNVGLGWSDITNNIPAPTVDKVGIEYSRQGIGWIKACKMYLQGCKI